MERGQGNREGENFVAKSHSKPEGMDAITARSKMFAEKRKKAKEDANLGPVLGKRLEELRGEIAGSDKKEPSN